MPTQPLRLHDAGPLVVTIGSRTVIPAGDLAPETLQTLQREFTHENSVRTKLDAQIRAQERPGGNRRLLGQLHARAKQEPKAIPTWKLTGEQLALPRGGTARALAHLEQAGHAVRFDDRRSDGDPALRHAYAHRVELWDFQQQIVDAVFGREQGLIKSPTGSGKTETLLRLAVLAGLPALIVVWTASLFDQWIRRVMQGLGLREDHVGAIQGSTKRLRPITIGMQQTLWRCAPEVAPRFGFVGADEVHKFAARTFGEVIEAFPARYRYGVSAEVKRKDGRECVIEDVFGEVEAAVDKDSLVAAGHVLDVTIYLVETGFRCEWYEKLADAAKGAEYNKLLDAMTASAPRNALIEMLTSEQVKQGHQVLVFSHRVEHCRRIVADVAKHAPEVGLLVGGPENREQFRQNIDGLLARKLRVGVGTYQAIGTGNDLPSVSRGIATTPIHNNAPLVGQVGGRLCRTSAGTGKTDAGLIYLWDKAIFGLAPLRRLASLAKHVVVWRHEAWVPAAEVLAEETAGRKARG